MKRSAIWLMASTSWLASGIQIDLLLTCLVLRMACAKTWVAPNTALNLLAEMNGY